MRTLRALRGRIRAAKNIQQITRAMKLVSAARLRRAQDRVLQARPYADSMRAIIQEVGRASDLPPHPLLEERKEVHHVGVVVLTADRGLCGAYNLNVIRKATELMNQYPLHQLRLICIGRRGYQHFNRRGYPVVAYYSLPTTGASLEEATQIANTLANLFVSREVDRLSLVYARFVNAATQRPQILPLLPIQPPRGEEEPLRTQEFLFEPPAPELLARLLPQYLFSQVFQALLEASASEHGARMTAMSQASENAGKMIQELTLFMNRVRQASITKEIVEVVTGAEALKG